MKRLGDTGTLSASETTLASAATTDLGTSKNRSIAITGTTTITSFGTGANREALIRFAAALTLTHNATSLILPGAANIVTAAGDTALATSDASGNWRVRQYQRGAGPPTVVPGGAWTAFTMTVSPFSGSITSYTATGRWMQIGKLVFFNAKFTITNNGDGSGGLNVFGLPVTSGAAEGNAHGKENAATNKAVAGRILANSTSMVVHFADGTYPAATGNTFTLSGFYEAA